jgi:hypothetical protein
MRYVLTFLEPEWAAIADRLETDAVPVEPDLVERIRAAVAHHPHGCACPVSIDLSPADADAVQTIHAEVDMVAIDALDV